MVNLPSHFEVLIVGGGIAGASLGAEIADRRSTLIIEAESHCGFHSTGRSAAFWLESYGGPAVTPLTRASRAFLASPPADFAERGFLRTRGALHLAMDEQPTLPEGIDSKRVSGAELERWVPGIRPEWRFAIFETGCADIDVAGLHAAYLGRFKRRGGALRTDQRLVSARNEHGVWRIALSSGETVTAERLVNAAGAWADSVAKACGVQPLDIAPMRRTMVQLRVGRSGLRHLPLIDDWAGTFYFKGEGDRSIWLSPHDEIASEPGDAAPDEIDVATAIARFEAVVDWPIEAVERRWAGLRSFAPDRAPIYGFDGRAPAFFWCVGQGGFGIQTAPAAAKLAAALLLRELPSHAVEHINPGPYSPGRFLAESPTG
ncbi:MAG TPA: FAD-dependent oxidoreductase [Sphingomicrobium sp.]|nr:FAD-dependent oxidoreductase [Sphingomicrobium sp.]